MVKSTRAVTAAGTAPAAAAPRAGASKGAARLWWRMHQWVGLKLSIFLAFILFTGTLATVSNEIDWLLRPALRVDPATIQGPVNWPAMTEAVTAAHAEASIVSLDAPIDRWFAASATIETPEGDWRFVYAHPTTGAVQGVGDWVGAQRILRNLHRHLNLPTKIGVPLVSALAVLLAISLATSFVVYKRWWRGFFKPIRLHRDARTAWGDAHRLMGLWSLWFLALITATSLWYLVESLGGDAPPFPSARAEPIAGSSAEIAGRLAPALGAARGAFPELRIERIGFPSDDKGAFVFQGQHRAILVRARANAVTVDANSFAVLRVVEGRDATAHQRISEMADPLHFGTFGGLATKLIWFAFGLAMTGLAVSGVTIYALRLARERLAPHVVAGPTSPPVSPWAFAWRGMGGWAWPALGAVAIGLVLMIPLIVGLA